MTEPGLTFRNAVSADVDAIVELVDSAYRGDSSRQGWTTEADLLDGRRTNAELVRAIVDDPTSEMRLAFLGEQLVASMQLENRPPDATYFGLFAVRPGFQGRRIGTHMKDEAERFAREEFGSSQMVMSVIRQRDDLIDWYLKLGYRPTGETLPFPYGDDRFGLPKREDLEFVVLAKPLV